MVLSSTHVRLTRTSSDLRMLSAILLPPSPTLKADDLLISSTSGEIPILLEATTHICDSPLPTLSEPPGFRDVAKEPKPIDKPDITRDLTRTSEALLEELDDPYTAPEFSNGHHEAEPPSDSCPTTRAISSEPKSSIYPAYDNVLQVGGDAEHSSTLGSYSTPVFVKQDGYEGLRDPQAFYPSTMDLSRGITPAASEEDLDDNQLLMTATIHTYSTLPTPTFAPPSPSSSADVISPSPSLVGRPRHRRPLERARAVRFPGRPRSPLLQVNEAESNLVRNTPPSSTKHASYPRWQLTDSPPPVSINLCMPDTRVSDTAVHPFMKHVELPEELSWIKHMIIELWIDQEGFRAVRPCMQLMGYSPRTRSLHPYEDAEDAGSCVSAGVAEFMPTKRETFAFHYATLDSPPTLRMVSVSSDEARDYISRQATLSVKAHGVYTVLGTESFMASILNGDSQGLRLRWKFDYLVSDRKVDGTGKVLPGKKTGLMHIMKKNLVPKLGSQKLEPPTRTPSHSILPPASRYLSIGRDATHTRSRSDAVPKSGHPLDTGVKGGAILGMNHIPRTRRRRASSAGENSLTCMINEPRRGGIITLKEGMFGSARVPLSG